MSHSKFLSPSSAPFIEKCAHFVGSERTSGAAEYGTAQHKYFAEKFGGEELSEEEWEALDDDQIAAVDWAESFAMKRNEEVFGIGVSFDIEVERRVEISHGFFTTFGTVDMLCVGNGTLHILDYKGGKIRDHWGQLKLYAMGAMSEFGIDVCHLTVAFGMAKTARTMTVTYSDCVDYFNAVVARMSKKGSLPPVSDFYCEYCSSRDTCPAIGRAVEAINQDATYDSIMSANSFDIATMPSDRLEKALGSIEMFEKLAKRINDELMERCRRGESLEKYELGTTNSRRSIINPVSLLKNADIPLDLVVEKCGVGITNVMELLYGGDAKKKASKDDFEKRFAHHVNVKPGNPCLKKK